MTARAQLDPPLASRATPRTHHALILPCSLRAPHISHACCGLPASRNVIDLVDHVLVMTVNPGFGGQAYIPTMTEKIKKIRKWVVDRGLDVVIEVDGGVKADWTIAECADAGANCFIAGSGMFKYADLSVGCSELRTIAEAAQRGKVLTKDQTIADLKPVAA